MYFCEDRGWGAGMGGLREFRGGHFKFEGEEKKHKFKLLLSSLKKEFRHPTIFQFFLYISMIVRQVCANKVNFKAQCADGGASL